MSAIPPGRALRIVGDVHGDLRAFAFAADTDRFVVQLGDLIDSGPDSAGALRLMFRLIDENRGLFLVGNHDRKLGRALRGERVRGGPQLDATMAALDAPLRARALAEVERAPAWLVQDRRFFVHAAFHTGMLAHMPPDPLGPVDPLLSRAMFGETTGRTQPDGFPERLLRWVNHIPNGMTVYCGHDQRSRDGRPWVTHGDGGGNGRVHGHGRGQRRTFELGGFGLRTATPSLQKKKQKTGRTLKPVPGREPGIHAVQAVAPAWRSWSSPGTAPRVFGSSFQRRRLPYAVLSAATPKAACAAASRATGTR